MNNAMNGWGGVTLAYPPAPATPILRDGTSGHGKQWIQPEGLSSIGWHFCPVEQGGLECSPCRLAKGGGTQSCFEWNVRPVRSVAEVCRRRTRRPRRVGATFLWSIPCAVLELLPQSGDRSQSLPRRQSL